MLQFAGSDYVKGPHVAIRRKLADNLGYERMKIRRLLNKLLIRKLIPYCLCVAAPKQVIANQRRINVGLGGSVAQQGLLVIRGHKFIALKVVRSPCVELDGEIDVV